MKSWKFNILKVILQLFFFPVCIGEPAEAS